MTFSWNGVYPSLTSPGAERIVAASYAACIGLTA
jgi:hypothetical protein